MNFISIKNTREKKDAACCFFLVKGNRKCELNCQAMGYRFYVRQAEKVIDGTPCDQNGSAICVSGQCKVSAPGLRPRGGCLGCLSSDCQAVGCYFPPPPAHRPPNISSGRSGRRWDCLVRSVFFIFGNHHVSLWYFNYSVIYVYLLASKGTLTCAHCVWNPFLPPVWRLWNSHCWVGPEGGILRAWCILSCLPPDGAGFQMKVVSCPLQQKLYFKQKSFQPLGLLKSVPGTPSRTFCKHSVPEGSPVRC